MKNIARRLLCGILLGCAMLGGCKRELQPPTCAEETAVSTMAGTDVPETEPEETARISQETYKHLEALMLHLVCFVMDEGWLMGTDTFTEENYLDFVLTLREHSFQTVFRHPYTDWLTTSTDGAYYEIPLTDARKMLYAVFGCADWEPNDIPWYDADAQMIRIPVSEPVPAAVFDYEFITAYPEMLELREGNTVQVDCIVRRNVSPKQVDVGEYRFVFAYVTPTEEERALLLTEEPYLRLTKVARISPEPVPEWEEASAETEIELVDPAQYHCCHIREFHSYDGKLTSYVGSENFTAWREACGNKEPTQDGCYAYSNLYRFIHDFEIPRQVVEEWYYGTNAYFRDDHDIDSLYMTDYSEAEKYYLVENYTVAQAEHMYHRSVLHAIRWGILVRAEQSTDPGWRTFYEKYGPKYPNNNTWSMADFVRETEISQPDLLYLLAELRVIDSSEGIHIQECFDFDYNLLYTENAMDAAMGEGILRKLNEDRLFCGLEQLLP